MTAVSTSKPLNDERLIDILAHRVMGWRTGPDRFIKSGRCWIPRWRFDPLTRLDDAFLLLDQAAAEYRLQSAKGGMFAAAVRINSATGKASGSSKARVIAYAVARAVGIDTME